MKVQEFRDQSVEELKANLEETKRELFELRNQQRHSTKIEKPHLLKQKKREIAQIKTILREKELVSQ